MVLIRPYFIPERIMIKTPVKSSMSNPDKTMGVPACNAEPSIGDDGIIDYSVENVKGI